MAEEKRGFGGGQLDPGTYGEGKGQGAEAGMAELRRHLGDEVFHKSRADGSLLINENKMMAGAGRMATGIAMRQRNIEAMARSGKTEEAIELRKELNKSQDEVRALYANSTRIPSPDSKEYKGYAAVQKATGRQADIEGVELASRRSDVRDQRARLRLAGPDATLNEDERQKWEGHKESLIEEMRKTVEEQNEAKANDNKELSSQLSMRMSSQGNLLSEIESILNYNMRQNASAVDNVMGFLGNLAGILSVGQIASRAFIQDPFQYEFMPAMGALGRQGEIGSMMGSALTSYEQYDVQLRQMSLTAGVGGVLGGIGQMRGATTLRGGVGGAAMIGAGLVAGSGLGVDMLQEIGWLKDKDDIVSARIAEQAVNPERLMQYYDTSRAGLLQVGAGENMGFTTNQSVASMDTGNTVLDRISGGPGDIDKFSARDPNANVLRNLKGLGYSGEELGQYLSSASMQMRGDEDTLFDAVGMAGVLEAGYGVGADQTLGNMASLQRGGVAPGDVRSRMYQSMGAVAEDGQVSNYAQNVLVPALNQVVESMAIQNVARSNEDLTEEIYGFRALLSDSDTNLGRLVQANPEAFSRLYGSMVQGVKSAVDDPARLAYNMSLGSSFMDIISGDPEVLMRQINRVMSSSYVSQMDFNDPDSINPGVLRNISAITGIGDLQMLISLLQLAQEQGGTLETEDVTRLRDQGEDAVSQRREDVEATKLANLRVQLAEQINAAATATLSVFDEIIILQDGISNFINEGKFDENLDAGIRTIVNATLKALDQETLDERDRRLALNAMPSREVRQNTSDSLQSALRDVDGGGRIANRMQFGPNGTPYFGLTKLNQENIPEITDNPAIQQILMDFLPTGDGTTPGGGGGGGARQGSNTGASVTGREENEQTLTVTITGPSTQAFANRVKSVMGSDISALQRQIT